MPSPASGVAHRYLVAEPSPSFTRQNNQRPQKIKTTSKDISNYIPSSSSSSFLGAPHVITSCQLVVHNTPIYDPPHQVEDLLLACAKRGIFKFNNFKIKIKLTVT